MRQHKTRNNPNNLRPILWFNSRNKIEKMCIAISCLIFLSSLIILLSLVAINKNKDFNILLLLLTQFIVNVLDFK